MSEILPIFVDQSCNTPFSSAGNPLDAVARFAGERRVPTVEARERRAALHLADDHVQDVRDV